MTISRRAVLKLGAGAGAALLVGNRRSFARIVERRVGAAPILRPIPSSGEMLPVVGIGTRTYTVEPELRPILTDILTRMPQQGGKVIDTATGYTRGQSETIIGELVEEIGNREDLFFATKVRGEAREEGVAQIEQSFRKLRTDVIDLLQVHNLVGYQTQLATLRKLQSEGRIRYIGVTTSSYRQFEDFEQMMRNEDLDFVQLNYSINQRLAEETLLPLAAERRMAVLVNLPYGRGRTFARVGDRPLPDWAASFADSWGQFFLKFVVSHPAVTVAIPGTTQLRHLVDNLGAAEGDLPDAQTRTRMIELYDSLPEPETDR